MAPSPELATPLLLAQRGKFLLHLVARTIPYDLLSWKVLGLRLVCSSNEEADDEEITVLHLHLTSYLFGRVFNDDRPNRFW